jgi:Tol biopolymer transport system component
MKHIPLIACAVATAAAVTIHGASSRPMTIDDLITAIRVSEPQLSPDGKLAAYVRTVTDGKTGRRNADIWTVATDGSASPQMLIGGDSSELTPTFSPDGKHLAFISTRGGAPQVFLATTSGQDVRAITKLAMGVQTPLVFSPDGARVAYVSDVYPECGRDCPPMRSTNSRCATRGAQKTRTRIRSRCIT